MVNSCVRCAAVRVESAGGDRGYHYERALSPTKPRAGRASDGATHMNDGKFVGWRKSSHSGDGNSCVEAAILAQPEPLCTTRARGVGVRDSQQDGRGPVLEFGRAASAEFIVRSLNRLSL